MRTRIRRGAIPLGLAAAAFVLALLQRPGLSSSDTKIDLHTRAADLLADVAHLWTSTAGLGGVQSAQYSGYLFPMGPWFAGLHALGISDWLADRLWLGAILALGCWGVVRLGDVLFERPRGVAQLTAGLVYLLNPYVVVFANRTSVTLLAYAALPWLVLFAWRGLRAPTRWRMPAAFALVLTASGPGVNVAVVAFVLLGPALLVLFEAYTRAVDWRAAWSFAWRTGVTSLAASLWWLVPAAAQAKYGIDFLKFTEPAGAIWSTTSLTESLRLMGYWIAYIGVGYGGVVGPYFSDAGTLLFEPLVVVASLAVPGLALWGFAWTRRARYAAYLLGLVLVALVLMVVGFPDGTPLRRAVTGAYNHVPSIRFLRTTYKAGPLLALGLAGLGGIAVAMAAERLRGWTRVAGAAALLALLLLSAWPLVQGKAVDRQMTWERIPSGWTAAADELDRLLPGDKRALVIPGQLYGFYRWGGTVDPILPALTDKPVAVRTVTPYGDLHGTDLLWTTDALVQQDRLAPSQLAPLVRLLGASKVITGSDDDFHRSGATDPAIAAQTLAAQGFARPDTVYGPDVRGYDVGNARPEVRLQPQRPAAVVDGSAQGLTGLAAFGELPRGSIEYAGDLDAAHVRDAARRGAEIVVTDSNRRRVVVISRMRQSTGATLGPDDPISEDAAVLNPFPQRGSAGQTVSALHGARWIRSPFSPGYSQFPEHRPFAALDGDPRTYWLADAALQPDRHWIEIGFDKPLDIPYVDLLPRTEAGAVPDVASSGSSSVKLHAGWSRLRLDRRAVRSLRILVTAKRTGSAAAAGLAELRVPGVAVTQSLRPPTLAESALRGADLDRAPLTYLFERTTGDRPFRRASPYGSVASRLVHDPDELEALRVRGAGDGEMAIDRVFSPPAARAWSIEGWAQVTERATSRTGCGAATVTIGSVRVPMRIAATPADIAARRPLRARSCGEPVRIPAGSVRLRTGADDDFRLNLLRLRSPAPNPVTVAPGPGRVTDTGERERGGARDGVRLELAGPGTLVLGQSYSSGWRAYCDGRSLGAPRIVDGYANAWDVEPPCREARFSFAPDKPVRWIQLLSALACLLLLAVAMRPRRADARAAADADAREAADADARAAADADARAVAAAHPAPVGEVDRRPVPPHAKPHPWRRALVLGALAAAVLGFTFSLRAGVAIFLGVTLIARFRIGPRVLSLAAGALLTIVVPAVYLLWPAEDRGGYNPGYAGEHIGAHWVGVAAFVLLAVALIQALSTARSGPRGAAAGAAAAGEGRSRP